MKLLFGQIWLSSNEVNYCSFGLCSEILANFWGSFVLFWAKYLKIKVVESLCLRGQSSKIQFRQLESIFKESLDRNISNLK